MLVFYNMYAKVCSGLCKYVVESMRWPKQVFYNAIDMALVNSGIIYSRSAKAVSAEENLHKRLQKR